MRAKKVLIIDTSILCVWLKVPGMETCGEGAKWNFDKVDKEIKKEPKETTFVLPLATIIETGNHISQSKGNHRYKVAESFADLLRKSADSISPWAAFSDQVALWSNTKLHSLADSWPDYAAAKLSMGDVTIKDVAEYYAQSSCEVEIFTGDEGLKAYQPASIESANTPRRQLNKR